MRWKDRRQSVNVVDRRGAGGTIGIGGLIIGALVYYFMGGNPNDYVAQNAGNKQQQQVKPTDDNGRKFAAVILADTEDVWNDVFKTNGIIYQEPRLVLFTNLVQSSCGRAKSAVGPFYCPQDQQVYLDLGFFDQLSKSLAAEGDFAVAYVIAHEVGHHVQNLLGVEASFLEKQSIAGPRERNSLSIKMELQADCLAGVWAKLTDQEKNILEEGDIEEALNAASAVGDDRLQKAGGREVVPDSFTHGTSAQRVDAFKTGYRSGQTKDCLNTYK